VSGETVASVLVPGLLRIAADMMEQAGGKAEAVEIREIAQRVATRYGLILAAEQARQKK